MALDKRAERISFMASFSLGGLSASLVLVRTDHRVMGSSLRTLLALGSEFIPWTKPISHKPIIMMGAMGLWTPSCERWHFA